MSQNSAFWGAVQAGSAAQNVLGLEVVTADGNLLGVGAHGGPPNAPVFWRDHGPELTGLFTADCGALGLKVCLSLPLERRPPARSVIAFGFDDPYAVLRALSELAREQLITEACFFDQGQQNARVTDAKIPLAQLLSTGWAVARESGPAAALGMALAGKRYLADVVCSLNLIVEASCRPELKRRMAEIRAIAAREQGRAINPMIARVLCADHFPVPETTLAEHRFLPVHGIVPHSRAAALYAEIVALFAANAEACKRLSVTTGVFSIAVGAGAILIEPTWHWTGAFLEGHARLYEVPPERLGNNPPNPEAEAFVDNMRFQMMEIFLAAGAANFQLGKVYPFQRSRNAANLALLTHLKHQLDPQGLMNPGALGWSS
jgi:FAD/FMN-containing dehydrogenase